MYTVQTCDVPCVKRISHLEAYELSHIATTKRFIINMTGLSANTSRGKDFPVDTGMIVADYYVEANDEPETSGAPAAARCTPADPNTPQQGASMPSNRPQMRSAPSVRAQAAQIPPIAAASVLMQLQQQSDRVPMRTMPCSTGRKRSAPTWASTPHVDVEGADVTISPDAIREPPAKRRRQCRCVGFAFCMAKLGCILAFQPHQETLQCAIMFVPV